MNQEQERCEHKQKEGDPKSSSCCQGLNKKQSSWLAQTNGWKLAYTQSECSQDKKHDCHAERSEASIENGCRGPSAASLCQDDSFAI